VVPRSGPVRASLGYVVFSSKPDLTAEVRPSPWRGTATGRHGRDGTAADEQIVIDGQLRLVPGAKVE